MLGVSFSRIQGDSQAYISGKLRAAGVVEEDLRFIDRDLGPALVLADPSQLTFSADAQIEVRARRRCATQTAGQTVPLLQGEVVEEDFFTCLDQPLEELQRGTPVLRRTTNMGVTYVFFPDYRINEGNELVYTGLPGVLLDPDLFAEAEEDPLATLEGLTVAGITVAGLTLEKLGLKLALALVNAAGGKVDALAWSQFFDGLPSYFDQ